MKAMRLMKIFQRQNHWFSQDKNTNINIRFLSDFLPLFIIIYRKCSKNKIDRNKKAFENKGFFCEGRRIRTFDRLLRRQVLYPAELCLH